MISFIKSLENSINLSYKLNIKTIFYRVKIPCYSTSSNCNRTFRTRATLNFLINYKLGLRTISTYLPFYSNMDTASSSSNKNDSLNADSSNSKLKIVKVRCVPNEDYMSISLYHKSHSGKERPYHLKRPKTELMSQSISRLCKNIGKRVSKSRKKADPDNLENLVKINLFLDKKFEDSDPENKDAWCNSSLLSINDGHSLTEYTISINVPNTKTITLPNCIMVGFSIKPFIECEFVDLCKSKIVWFREQKNESDSSVHWIKLSENFTYTPTPDDINCFIRISFTPSSNQEFNIDKQFESIDVVSPNTVQAGPGVCPFDTRHLYTTQLLPKDNFRIVSYNILASYYADGEFAREHLFPHCAPYAMEIDYRKQLIIKELLGYNADIICLQEVDKKVFENDLLPKLSEDGFFGSFRLKHLEIPEGMATFYRKAKFSLHSQRDISINDALKEDQHFSFIRETIDLADDELKEKIYGRRSSMQVSVLQHTDTPCTMIISATTHLYFHPRYSNIRIIQTIICLHHLSLIKMELEEQGFNVGIVFAGDFNSEPMDGVVKLILSGSIENTHQDWVTLNDDGTSSRLAFSDEKITHSLNLSQASGEPRYTNYLPTFCGHLDHIFISTESLRLIRTIPMPPHNAVEQHSGLPSPLFPSDHLPVISELEWISESTVPRIHSLI